MTVRQYSSARDRYRPDKIGILLIAESPPASNGYFYFRKTIGKDHLFRETMKALDLWPRTLTMKKGLDKRPLLEEFKRRRFFLVDTCTRPVDKLSSNERKLRIVEGASSLGTRIKRLNPDSVILVKKTIFKPARDAIKAAGFGDRILNHNPIPFPSHGNQRAYRTVLRRLIKTNEGS